MGRIRSIKPEFLRHEGLQDLEKANPGKYPMLVFAGLWTACDKSGRFEWRPRTLKLDILPFLVFDMEETLTLLEGAGQVKRYIVDGKEYGLVPTFEEHQRITGKEAQSPSKFPAPTQTTPVKPLGIIGETPVKQPGAQEGKGREEEEEGNGEPAPEIVPSLPTMTGAICVALRAKGIGAVNPSHPDLAAMLEKGIDIGAFVAAAEKAVAAGKGTFAYVLGIVKGQAAQSAQIATAAAARAPAPAAQTFHERKAEAERQAVSDWTGGRLGKPKPIAKPATFPDTFDMEESNGSLIPLD